MCKDLSCILKGKIGENLFLCEFKDPLHTSKCDRSKSRQRNARHAWSPAQEKHADVHVLLYQKDAAKPLFGIFLRFPGRWISSGTIVCNYGVCISLNTFML